MPVDGDVPWDCQEHTVAKHDIYRRYLRRWFPILLSSGGYPSVTYAEGFSGPGHYRGGEPGSPVIAMRALMEEVAPGTGVARFLFVDDDQRCVDMLKAKLVEAFPARPRSVEAMPLSIKLGTCEQRLEAELTDMGAWGMPIFANLDSWGNSPVPYRLLQRLAQNPSSEVIVTLLPQHFVRFVGQKGADADDIFGGDAAWRDVSGMASDAKSRHILTCYRSALKRAGFPYILDFELVPRNGQPLYLVFGTSHPLGVEKMKDSLWEVDRTQGVGFRDPRDEQAETLFVMDEAQLGPLTRLLQHRLGDRQPHGVEELRRWTLFETVYRPQHVLTALQPLRERGVISTDEPGRLTRRSQVRLSVDLAS